MSVLASVIWDKCTNTAPLFFFFKLYIGVQLVSSSVIVPAEQRRTQQSTSVYLFSPKPPSRPGCHVTWQPGETLLRQGFPLTWVLTENFCQTQSLPLWWQNDSTFISLTFFPLWPSAFLIPLICMPSPFSSLSIVGIESWLPSFFFFFIVYNSLLFFIDSLV